MNPLALTEARFQDNVLTGNPAIDNEIEGVSEQFRNTRLGIYRDAYRLRLMEVLGTDYEVLRKYLGDKLFQSLAEDYIADYPSTFRNVRWFGGKLEEFLRSSSRYVRHPELAELAHFEWSLGRAFDAQDTEVVPFEEVAAVTPQAWAELRFIPHPALHVLTLQTNAVAIWKAVGNDDHSIEAENYLEPVAWAVWRDEHSPCFRSMKFDEAWALSAMMSQASFGELCAGLCDWVAEKDAAARAAGLLRGWVDAGWIARLQIAD